MVFGDRHFSAYGIHCIDIDRAKNRAGLIFKFADYFSPWVDTQAVAPGFPAIGMGAALRRRDDVHLIFDRSGA